MVMFSAPRRILSGFLPGSWRSKARGTTLLFVSAERTLRLDADGDGALLGGVQEFPLACDSPERLAELVAAALAAGGEPEAAVWVLYEGLELRSLMLPSAQVDGLEGDALREALRFEAEVSGLAPGGMELALEQVSSLDGMSTFALCLSPPGLAEAVRGAVRKTRARLAGLGHPAALPRSLAGGETWQRLEYWPSVTVGVAGAPGGRRWTQTFQANAQGGAARKEVERWRRLLPAGARMESLNSRAALELDTESETSFLLLREGDGQRWLRAWLEVLRGPETAGLPFFRPVSKPLPEPVWITLLTAAALGVCLAHYGWYAHKERTVHSEAETLKKAEADMKTVQDSLRKQEEERDKLEQVSRMRRENQAAIPEVVSGLRQRFAHLLYELAAHRGDGVVLEKLASQREGVDVEGVTVDEYEANRFATALGQPMARFGWRVEQPTREDLKTFGEGGPWRFTFRLRDEGLAGFAPRASEEKKP